MVSDADVQTDLICILCAETLRIPKLLTCMHTFCEACIKPLIAYDTGELTCPLCRHVTQTKDGTRSISTNFIAQNIIDAFEVMTLKSEGILACSECDRDEAKLFCCDCISKLCLICSEHHKRSVKFKNHNVLDFDEISRSQLSQGRIKKCREHGEVLKFYCNDCYYTICQDCSVSKKHSGHKLQLIHEIVTENKEELETLMSGASKKKKAMQKSIKEAENILQNVCNTKEYSIFVIEEAFGKINDLLTMKKKRLIKILEMKYEEGVESIHHAKETTRILDEWIQFSHTVMESKCEAEIMDVFTNLKRQLEEISAMRYMTPKSSEDVVAQRDVPTVKQNPNAKAKPRITNITQILGLQSPPSNVAKEPFSSHSSLSSSESETSLTAADTVNTRTRLTSQHFDATEVPIIPETQQVPKISATDINRIQANKTTESTDSMRKIIPHEMTPDIAISEQVKYETWDFHKSSASNDEIGNCEKKKPPLRPPPAKIHMKKLSILKQKPVDEVTRVKPLTQGRSEWQNKKRRQTMPSKPGLPPPPPPTGEEKLFQRTNSHPVDTASNLQDQGKKPKHPPPPPPQPYMEKICSTPSPLPESLSLHPESFVALNNIHFPGPPSITPSGSESPYQSECWSTKSEDSEENYLFTDSGVDETEPQQEPNDLTDASSIGQNKNADMKNTGESLTLDENNTAPDQEVFAYTDESAEKTAKEIHNNEEEKKDAEVHYVVPTSSNAQNEITLVEAHTAATPVEIEIARAINDEWKSSNDQNLHEQLTGSKNIDELAMESHSEQWEEDKAESFEHKPLDQGEYDVALSNSPEADQNKQISPSITPKAPPRTRNVRKERLLAETNMNTKHTKVEIKRSIDAEQHSDNSTNADVQMLTIRHSAETADESHLQQNEENNDETFERQPLGRGEHNGVLPHSPEADQDKQKGISKQPQPPPRFYAGIKMTKQEVIVNDDVLNLILEAISDACLLSSDQDGEVAQGDAMFSTKEYVFKQ